MPEPTMPSSQTVFFDAMRRCALAMGRDRVGAEDCFAAFAGLAQDPRLGAIIQQGLGLKAEEVVWPELSHQRWGASQRATKPAPVASMPYEDALKPALSNAYRGTAGFDLVALLRQLHKLDEPTAREFRRLNPPAVFESGAPALSRRLADARRRGRDLKAFLNRRVLGQESAIQAITRSYVTSRLRPCAAGPQALFTLMGPTGTGKTLVAQSLAEFHKERQDGPSDFLLLDMATYTGTWSHEKLWGFSPSYVDARAGVLTGFVKDHPACVIVFDEIEKASPDTLQSLLGVLDRGQGRDNFHEVDVDFSRTILCFTTNLGQARLAAKGGRTLDRAALLEILGGARKQESGHGAPPEPALSPELVSRLGKGAILAVNPLSQANLLKVFREGAATTLKAAGLPAMTLEQDADTLFLLQHAQGLDGRKARALGEELADRVLMDLVQNPGVQELQAPLAAIRITVAEEARQALRRKLDAVPLRLLVCGDPAGFRPLLDTGRVAWTQAPSWAEVPALLETLRPEAVLCTEPLPASFEFPEGVPWAWIPSDGAPGAPCGQALEFLDGLRHEGLFREQLRSHMAFALDQESALEPDAAGAPGLVLALGAPREARTLRDQDTSAAIGMMERPEGGFERIIGQKAAVKRLAKLAECLGRPSLTAPLAKGYLLTGSPGTGKTSLARALAAEAGVPFFAFGPGDLASTLKDEGAVRLNDVFNLAREYAPSIVFVDEVDAIAPSRATPGLGMEPRQILTTFLTNLDGIQPPDRPVFVLAATNRRDLLDEALLRPGRFDATIALELPGLDDRKALLQRGLAAIPDQPDLELDVLAQRSLGLSHADLEGLVREARQAASWEGRAVLLQQDLQAAFEAARLGTRSERTAYTPEAKRLVAAHEAGHAVVRAALLPGAPVTRIDIIPRASGIGGVTENLPVEGDAIRMQTRQSLQNEVASLMGGRAGELLLTGAEDQVSDGCSGDLDQATRRVRAGIAWGGLDPQVGLIALSPFAKAGETALEALVQSRTSAWLAEGHQTALEILRQNRKPWRQLVNRLVRDEVMEGPELEILLAKVVPA